MNVTIESIKSVVIYVLGLASAVIAVIPAVALPTNVRPWMVIGGLVLAAIERYIQGQVALVKLNAKLGSSK